MIPLALTAFAAATLWAGFVLSICRRERLADTALYGLLAAGLTVCALL